MDEHTHIEQLGCNDDVGAASTASEPQHRAPPRGTVLAAAMIGLGQVLEPQNHKEPTVLVAPAPDDEPDDQLSFGDLPPLD